MFSLSTDACGWLHLDVGPSGTVGCGGSWLTCTFENSPATCTPDCATTSRINRSNQPNPPGNRDNLNYTQELIKTQVSK